jgi:hypothetical protein
MDALLSMPLPFASSLIVLMLVAAFFFIKFLALALAPCVEHRYVLVSRQNSGRRASDRGVVLS